MPIQCDLFMTLKLPHVGDFYMLSEMALSIVQVHVEVENCSPSRRQLTTTKKGK